MKILVPLRSHLILLSGLLNATAWAQDDLPLKVGDTVLLGREQISDSGLITRPLKLKVSESGTISVPGLKNPTEAKGLTPLKLAEIIAAGLREEKKVTDTSIAVTCPPSSRAETIRAGAAVEIEVEMPQPQIINGTYIVSDSGGIRMPLLTQDIHAVTLTPFELAEAVTLAYGAKNITVAPKISIKENGEDPNRVITPCFSIEGEIKHFGDFPLRKPTTLLEGISRAGGFTEFADLSKVKITHKDGTASIFDVRKIEADGSNNPPLQADDSIIVP